MTTNTRLLRVYECTCMHLCMRCTLCIITHLQRMPKPFVYATLEYLIKYLSTLSFIHMYVTQMNVCMCICTIYAYAHHMNTARYYILIPDC